MVRKSSKVKQGSQAKSGGKSGGKSGETDGRAGNKRRNNLLTSGISFLSVLDRNGTLPYALIKSPTSKSNQCFMSCSTTTKTHTTHHIKSDVMQLKVNVNHQNFSAPDKSHLGTEY